MGRRADTSGWLAIGRVCLWSQSVFLHPHACTSTRRPSLLAIIRLCLHAYVWRPSARKGIKTTETVDRSHATSGWALTCRCEGQANHGSCLLTSVSFSVAGSPQSEPLTLIARLSLFLRSGHLLHIFTFCLHMHLATPWYMINYLWFHYEEPYLNLCMQIRIFKFKLKFII